MASNGRMDANVKQRRMNKWLLHTSYLKGLQKDKKTPLMLGDI
jgi:hypothetical protein